jgi:hypothetical protein
MSTELPVWAVAPGIPSQHVTRAALHAASVIDASGSNARDVRESYWHYATGGVFPEVDLKRGERLLVDCGLVEERDGQLFPTDELREMLDTTLGAAVELLTVRALQRSASQALQGNTNTSAALSELIPDPQRREELLLALQEQFDDERQRLVGAIGEEIVVRDAREELESLGHRELARGVRRVSLESDRLGYDVSAPRTSGRPRLIEVKATTACAGPDYVIHLTRNEAKIGARYTSDWRLVLCCVTDVTQRQGEVLGWCARDALDDLLPVDAVGGTWEQAALKIPALFLTPGLPRAGQ